jgi:hypothetical protein
MNRCRTDEWSDEPTKRHEITSMDSRVAELLEQHDAKAPLFPEFAPPAGESLELDDYLDGCDVTRVDIELPAKEPSWRKVFYMLLTEETL